MARRIKSLVKITPEGSYVHREHRTKKGRSMKRPDDKMKRFKREMFEEKIEELEEELNEIEI